jgi:rod shape-determining protein MreC
MARRSSYRKNEGRGYKTTAIVVTLLLLGVAGYFLTQKNRTIFSDTSNQVFGFTSSVISAPQKWFNSAGDYISSYFGNTETIRKLKQENRALLEWRDEAKALAMRLDQYEQLNNIKDEQIKAAVIGRLIGEVNGPFSNSSIVNVGSKDGIATDWVVINENGLVGRVISVSKDSSRVIMLTDNQSRIPVMGEETRGRAILVGDKSTAPLLLQLNTPNIIKNGERIITSGDDGVIPRGIAVGYAGIAPDKKLRVKLNSNKSAIDYVKLIKPNNMPIPSQRTTNPNFGQVAQDSTVYGASAILPDENGAANLPVNSTPDAIAQAQEIKRLKEQRDKAIAAAKNTNDKRNNTPVNVPLVIPANNAVSNATAPVEHKDTNKDGDKTSQEKAPE